ncbi:MAG: hypothetical protein ACRDJE_22820 [Dehalococcoidia bacterium]
MSARQKGVTRVTGRFAPAALATLALLLAAGCGTAQEQYAGTGKALAEPAFARVPATPVPFVTAPASPTTATVDGAAVAPGRLSAIDQPDQAHEACRPRVYELILGVTPHENAGESRVVACLVLDLGDLSVRTIDLAAP